MAKTANPPATQDVRIQLNGFCTMTIRLIATDGIICAPSKRGTGLRCRSDPEAPCENRRRPSVRPRAMQGKRRQLQRRLMMHRLLPRHGRLRRGAMVPKHLELLEQLNQDAWYRSGDDYANWALEPFAKDKVLIERLGLAAK